VVKKGKRVVDEKRVLRLNKKKEMDGPVLYWMSRDQRVSDNWALLYAQELAKKSKQSFGVVFCLVPGFLGATLRQYDFMLKGLQEVEAGLKKYNIPFFLLFGDPGTQIPKFAKKIKAGVVVTDFDSLKIKQKWQKKVARSLNVALLQVDAHNVVPCFVASPKQEYAARTIRPKIKKQLKQFLTPFGRVTKQKQKFPIAVPKINWSSTYKKIKVDKTVAPVTWAKPGEKAAQRMLRSFVSRRLKGYAQNRNDPNLNGQSNLSPYLHFGQIAAQRVALTILKSKAGSKKDRDSFLEELIIRKELSDNFCFYNRQYDSAKGFPNWALKTLKKHARDKRPYLYTRARLEKANTHDDLWNAAQIQMMEIGKMHGFLRMYWAKKILEWTKNYETALKIAIYLNDKYELDGRDPNGYVGIAWSIGGVHDRPWGERAIFGLVRTMTYEGCKKKFDVKKFVNKFN